MNKITGLCKNRRTHRAFRVDAVCRRNLVPAEHLTARILYDGLRFKIFPKRNVRQGDFYADSVFHAGLESSLCDFHVVTLDGMTFKPRENRLALGVGIAENHISQISVIIKCNGVQAPIHCPIKIDMTVFRIGLYRHASRRTALFKLQPQRGNTPLKFFLEIFGTGVHHVPAVRFLCFSVRVLAGDVPFHFKNNLTGNFRRNKRR